MGRYPWVAAFPCQEIAAILGKEKSSSPKNIVMKRTLGGMDVSGQPDLDIARNLRTVEWLRVEMLESIAQLHRAMLKDNDEALVDSLSKTLLSTYLLAKRMGVSPGRLDAKVAAKLEANIEKGHELERWYGDLSALRRHLVEKR